MRYRSVKLLLLLIFILPLGANGQKLVNSPFSRFNLGTLEPAGSFRSLGMGGAATALRDNSTIFFSNPASYSSLDTNSFVFDFGMDYSLNQLESGSIKYSSDDINFDHLIMGFPLAKGFGVSLGFVPLTNGYYRIEEWMLEDSPGYDPNVGEYSSYHFGSGGFNSFFIGSGINLTKNLSAGVNMTILSGQISRENQFNFSEYYSVFNDNSTERLRLSGINFDYGLQYFAKLNKNYFFNAGLSFTARKHYKTEYEHLASRYTAYGTIDSIAYI